MRVRFKKKGKKTYAIHGTGSTRLSIALANYYAGFLKKKVAISEVGSGNLSDVSDDVKVSRLHTNANDNNLVGFTKMKVDYYPYLSMESAMQVESIDYDVIIWDFQDISHDYMTLYRMCDTRIYLSNIASYNRRLFCKTKNLLEHDMVEVELYCYLLNKQDKNWYDKTVGKTRYFSPVREIPLIRDPNKLSREDITFLEKLAAG